MYGRKDAAAYTAVQKVYDIIHPERRNLTAIRGYKRIGGLPDDPHTDPQDRSWYGPHDRLFTEEEGDEMKFQTGPEYGEWARRDLVEFEFEFESVSGSC